MVPACLIVALLFQGSISFAQVRVTRISSPESLAGKKGIIYSLPRTFLAIDLQITVTDQIPGPYSAFAGELLGLEKVIDRQQKTYSLDHAVIHYGVEADPQQVFFVEKDEKSSEGIFLEFLPGGMIMGSEPIGEDFPVQDKFSREHSAPAFNADGIFPGYIAGEMKEIVDTIIRKVSFDTLTYEEKILKRIMVKQSEREKAMEAASMIADLGQDQYSILVGYQETAYSSEAMKYMIGKLEEQRTSYLQLFTGVTRKEEYVVTLKHVPGDGVRQTLTGFSPASGLVSADGNNDVVLQVDKKGISALAGDDANPAGFTGYYYRIPEACKVSVVYDDEVIGESELLINQYGVVRSLPTTVTRVEFLPETGGIKNVILE